MKACLNCGATLTGAFCSACGQRAIPAYPTVREMAGDAWQELSGYDGRIARSFRTLLRRPGALTVDVLEGRRASYVSPVRLYLVASVIYFIVAAAAPNISAVRVRNGTPLIDLTNPEQGVMSLPPEDRDKLLRDIERAPWWLKPLMKPALSTPGEFRRRFLIYLPRVLFVLVPVFAGIVALFYRRGRFLVHLIFALHLHSAIFMALSVAQLSNFSRNLTFTRICGLLTFGFLLIYGLLAFRRVYGESWPWTLMKSAGIATLYLAAGLCGLVVTFVWMALT